MFALIRKIIFWRQMWRMFRGARRARR